MNKSVLLLAIAATLFLAACGGGSKVEKLTDPQIDAKVVMQLGHYWNMAAVAVSPDGKLVATASYDQSVIIWDMESEKELFVVRAATPDEKWGNFITLDFSTDGSLLAAGSDVGIVKLIDPKSGTVKNSMETGYNTINKIEFSPDGSLVAAAGTNKLAKVWDVASAAEKLTLEGHTRSVSDLNFSSDNKLIVTASSDSTCKIWNVEDGSVVKEMEIENAAKNAFFTSDDAKVVCNSSSLSKVFVFDAKSGKKVKEIESYFGTAVAAPDAKQIIAAHNSAVKLIDIETGEEVKTIADRGGWKLNVNAEGKLIGVAGSGGGKVYDIEGAKQLKELGKMVRTPLNVHVSPTGKFILTENSHVSSSGGPDLLSYPVDTALGFSAYGTSGSGGNILDFKGSDDLLFTEYSYGSLAFYNLATAQNERGFDGKMTTPVIFAPDGSYLVAKDKSDTKSYGIFNAETGEKTKELVNTSAYYYFGGFSPDGKYFAIRTMDFFNVYEMPAGTEVKSYEKREEFDNIAFMGITADGKHVAGDIKSNELGIKDILTGAEIVHVPVKKVKSAAMSPDGKTVAVGTTDWGISIFDIATKTVTKTISGHMKMVTSLAFTPNGKFLLSTSNDKTTKIWDVAAGKEVLTLIGLEKCSEYEGETKDFVVVAPNGRIDGPKQAIEKVIKMEKGGEIVGLDAYWDKIYTPNLLGRTLGQNFAVKKE